MDKVDFDLRKGEVHALVGENGAGKSTLIKILSGVYNKDKDSGRILLDDNEVNFFGPRDAFEAGISVIHQEFNLIPFLDVGTNIFIHRPPLIQNRWGRLWKVIDRKKIYRDTKGLLESMEANFSPLEKVEKLSASRKKIVEIAKALSADARIIFMDEPTASLPPEEQKELFRRIHTLKEHGVSIVYISHRLEEILEVADRITILREGKRVNTLNVKETNLDEIIHLMVGKDIKNRYPKEYADIGKVVFEVIKLSRGTVLRDVSFSVREGEILGVAGLVGSGRTELARAIFGVDRVNAGKILLDGKEIHIRSTKNAIDNGLAFLTEDRKKEGLVMPLSVQENFILPSINSRIVSRNFLRYPNFLLFPKIRRVCEDYVKKLSIKCPSIEQKVAYLSGGNQQKVIIAKWLCTKAKVYIVDEPTAGIDVLSKVEIYRIMENLAKQGMAIIMISSELEELISVSDRIIVMKNGTIAGELLREEFSKERILHLSAAGKKENLNNEVPIQNT